MDTEECREGLHDSCDGYTGPESDPELCECNCHTKFAEFLYS